MLRGKFVMLMACAALAMGTATALADTPSQAMPARCALSQYTIVAVEPYEIDVRPGRGTVTELRGAQLYVPAQPGLTAEWLQLTLQREFAKGNGNGANACSFNNNLRIEVISGGSGFWVRLIAPDAKEGAKVLERARELLAAQVGSR
jgi:hypothetical protein